MLGKGIAIIAIGIPALTRVIINYFINSIAGLEAVGNYANDYNISMILATITATGFSAVILNKLPGNTRTQKRNNFNLIFQSTLIILAIEVILVFVIGEYIIIENYFGSTLLVISYTLSQLIRSYFLAQHRYLATVFFEGICIIAIVVLMFVFREEFIVLHGTSLLVVSLVFIGFILKPAIKGKGIKKILKDGTAFGLSNLTSSLLFYISIPVAHNFLGAEYSGIIGLINPLLSILLLIPRSLNTHFIPILVNARDNVIIFESVFVKLKKYAYLSLFAIAILSIIVLYVVRCLFFKEVSLDQTTTIVLLLILNVVATQISLPFSTLLLVQNRAKLMLIVNLVMACSFFIIMQYYLSSLEGINAFNTIYGVLISLNLGKFLYLKFKLE